MSTAADGAHKRSGGVNLNGAFYCTKDVVAIMIGVIGALR